MHYMFLNENIYVNITLVSWEKENGNTNTMRRQLYNIYQELKLKGTVSFHF